jgi:hypothetical protein
VVRSNGGYPTEADSHGDLGPHRSRQVLQKNHRILTQSSVLSNCQYGRSMSLVPAISTVQTSPFTVRTGRTIRGEGLCSVDQRRSGVTAASQDGRSSALPTVSSIAFPLRRKAARKMSSDSMKPPPKMWGVSRKECVNPPQLAACGAGAYSYSRWKRPHRDRTTPTVLVLVLITEPRSPLWFGTWVKSAVGNLHRCHRAIQRFCLGDS